MIDVISGGRLITGFVRGIGAEYYAFGVNPTFSRDRFHEAHDLIVAPGPSRARSRSRASTTRFRYVNVWPRPIQKPHPPIWIPSQGKQGDDRVGRRIRDRRYTYLQTFSPVKVVEALSEAVPRDLQRLWLPGEGQPARLGGAGVRRRHRRIARREAKLHFENFRNVYVKMPLEMLLPPGYTSRESLKNVMKAKAQMFGDVSIEQAIELGLFVCGSAETVTRAFTGYWNEMRFGNLLVMCQFGTLPADLTRANMERFAREDPPRAKETMKTRAAVAHKAGKPLAIETVELDGPEGGRGAGRDQGDRHLPHRRVHAVGRRSRRAVPGDPRPRGRRHRGRCRAGRDQR